MHTCETCDHWKKREGRSSGIAVNVGECHANPPVTSHHWPLTQGSEFCSQHSKAQAARYAQAQPEPLTRRPAKQGKLPIG
ncbi:MAG TPA: hypothetical protein VK178_07080 [Opitutaceae bacterium]|nr:hypothetical protein [Opitutaceae bacterium]HLP26734.1 hypothetical protein [Acidobacteriota bacterium]